MNSRRPRRRDRDTVKRTWSRGCNFRADFARNAERPSWYCPRQDAGRLIIFRQAGDAFPSARPSRNLAKSLVREVQLLIPAYCPFRALAALVRSCRPANRNSPLRRNTYRRVWRVRASRRCVRFPSARSPINAGGSVRYGAGVPDLQRRGAISRRNIVVVVVAAAAAAATYGSRFSRVGGRARGSPLCYARAGGPSSSFSSGRPLISLVPSRPLPHRRRDSAVPSLSPTPPPPFVLRPAPYRVVLSSRRVISFRSCWRQQRGEEGREKGLGDVSARVEGGESRGGKGR